MIDQLFHAIVRHFGISELLTHAIVGALIFCAFILSGKLLKYILNTGLRKLLTKTENLIDDKILDIVLERILAFFAIAGIHFWTLELRKGLDEDNTSFVSFLDYSDSTLYIITAVLVTSVIIKISRTIVSNILSNLAKQHDYEEYGQTLPLLTNRVISFIVIAIASIIVLDRFEQNIASILTILGAGSLAIGLAAQDTISNMISGFIIMIDRPFRVGDRIRIPTGEVGDVYEIGLRSTKILDFDNNLVIVPNNDLVKTRIVNYGYPKGEIRVIIEVSVAYGADINRVKKIMLDAAAAHPNVLKEPAPEVFLMKLADWSLNFSMFCRVPDFKVQFKTAEALRIRIYNELKNEKIEIPFPQQVIHHKSDGPTPLHSSPKRKKISR